jgi:aldehyde oxidoreductase
MGLVVAAHDAGKILNPLLFQGQIQGAVHMGIGYAISENFPMQEGQSVNTHYRKLGILFAKKMPEVEVIGVEVPDPIGPVRRKGGRGDRIAAHSSCGSQCAVPV